MEVVESACVETDGLFSFIVPLEACFVETDSVDAGLVTAGFSIKISLNAACTNPSAPNEFRARSRPHSIFSLSTNKSAGDSSNNFLAVWLFLLSDDDNTA